MFSFASTLRNRKTAIKLISSAAATTLAAQQAVTLLEDRSIVLLTKCEHHHFCEDEEEDEESRNFHETLQHHKRHLDHYKQAWNWHNATSRIPTISWPLDIPKESDISTLSMDLSFCQRRRRPNNSTTTASNEEDDNENDPNRRYCNNLQFRLASYMLLQQDMNIQKKGYKIVQNLAEKETHPDSICAYATCLNDGRAGIEPNPQSAVSWWKNASDKYDHIQSTYEMGVALYTGEGVAENEHLAVQYFRKAAECGHAGASYMLGDCLLDGVGVERDRGEALEWLVTAAELGHRGARSRVLAVLEMKEGEDYGDFTDASRQSFADKGNKKNGGSAGVGTGSYSDRNDRFTSGKQRDEKEKPYSGLPATIERRFTIGGGARNPAVLARRKTIVSESRKLE